MLQKACNPAPWGAVSWSTPSQEDVETMSGVARLSGVALECPDPRALAGFYSQLTGWPIVYEDDEWCTVGENEQARPNLAFQKAPGYQPPHWPDPASSMQYHLDFDADDLDAAEQRCLALGATKFETQPNPTRWRVLADPVGHPFCISAAQ
jgi:hypothetical protein